jgi:malate synthase A
MFRHLRRDMLHEDFRLNVVVPNRLEALARPDCGDDFEADPSSRKPRSDCGYRPELIEHRPYTRARSDKIGDYGQSANGLPKIAQAIRAQIPIRDDPAANEAAMDKVRADKEREVGDGHDGTWVAHPGLVAVAKEVFDREMPLPNQITRKRQDVHVAAHDLLAIPQGTISEAGLRQNLNVGIGYIEAWLRGTGCVPLYHLMEDAATAEISRAQIWQWIRHRARLKDGRIIDAGLCRALLEEELGKLRQSAADGGRYDDAAKLVGELIEAPTFPEFLTLPAYDMITADFT